MPKGDEKKTNSREIIKVLQGKQKILREELEKKDFIITSWIKRNFYEMESLTPSL